MALDIKLGEDQEETVSVEAFYAAYKSQSRKYIDLYMELPAELKTIQNRHIIMLAASNSPAAKPVPKSLYDALGFQRGAKKSVPLDASLAGAEEDKVTVKSSHAPKPRRNKRQPAHSMSFTELMETVRVHTKISGKDISWCYAYLSEEAAEEYPMIKALRHEVMFNEGIAIKGWVSEETAKSILSIFEKWRVYDPPLLDAPRKAEIVWQETALFAENLNEQRERTGFSLSAIWAVLDKDIKRLYRLNELQADLSNKERLKSAIIPQSLAIAILEKYTQIPGWNERVRVEEATSPENGSFCPPFFVPPEVIATQLGAALSQKNLTPNDLAVHMEQSVGIDAETVLWMFDENNPYGAPRQRVAQALIALNEMEPIVVPAVVKKEEIAPASVIQKSSMAYDDFKSLVQKWEQEKRVGFENIVRILPMAHQSAAKGYVSFLAGKRQSPPEFSFEMVTDIRKLYDKIPHADHPASPDDINCDDRFDREIILQMSSRVADEQIKAAWKTYKFSPKRLISELVEAGFSERSATLILSDDKKGELVSRRLVGAVLSKMGVEPTQETTLSPQKLELPDHLVDVKIIREKLDRLFNEAGGVSAAVAYNQMPTSYRNSIDFNEVAGWWDGRVDIAQKDKFGMYVSAAIAAIEVSPLPA